MTEPALRDDFSRLEIVHTDEMDWEQSPQNGVWRKRLERSGPAESGRVTSVVRYDPGARFAPHPHPQGEEILVLSGVFCDEHGEYPAGTYLLNPEGYHHEPFSKEGCVLFVKLRQYLGGRQACIDTSRAPWQSGIAAGVQRLVLHSEPDEPVHMHLLRIEGGAAVPRQKFRRGEELFVLEGSFQDEHGKYREGSWVRFPAGSEHTLESDDGCKLFVKKGHLG